MENTNPKNSEEKFKEKALRLIKENEQYLNPSFFVGGFVFDVISLGRIDDLFNILSLSVYLMTSLLIFMGDMADLFSKEFFKKKYFFYFLEYRSEVFHFCQGALLSAFTLFYFKSASLSASFIFLIIMTAFLFLNEFSFIQKAEDKGMLVKAIFINMTLLSFFIVLFPVLIARVGLIEFIIAIILFLITSYFIKFLLSQKLMVDSGDVKRTWWYPSLIFAGIFFLMRLLQITPPVPLSLETAGIYHEVKKEYPKYKLSYEKPWWRFWHTSDELFVARPGDKIYFFTRIFAPGGFEDQVFVHWQSYTGGKWQSSDRIPLKITGGRSQGFRGVTYKSNYTPGEWRVMVETKGGLEIGRLSFEVIASNEIKTRQFKTKMDK